MSVVQSATRVVDPKILGCRNCPLSSGSAVSPDLSLIESFKIAHGRAWSGDVIIEQGSRRPRLFTIFSGWAIKYKSLESGERQVVHLLLPGDLVGVETCMLGVAEFGVQAVTDVTFCSFDADRFADVAAAPGISRRIMMLQAHESSMIAERLTAVGACDAKRNLAHLIASVHLRLLKLGLAQQRGFRLPLSIQQIADCCGLTPVHVHRVLRALREENILALDCRKIEILDVEALRNIARVANVDLPNDAIL